MSVRDQRHPSCSDSRGETALVLGLAACLSDRHVVHSFDHVAINDEVLACDMAHTGLEDESLDDAVFSLSLMGANVGDYLKEAWRALKLDGQLHIVEASSRFRDVGRFCQDLSSFGFTVIDNRGDVETIRSHSGNEGWAASQSGRSTEILTDMVQSDSRAGASQTRHRRHVMGNQDRWTALAASTDALQVRWPNGSPPRRPRPVRWSTAPRNGTRTGRKGR